MRGRNVGKGKRKMSDPQENRQNEFMIEKIKERPVNKKKLIRRTIITASMAVIFGLIACFTFLVLEPVISNWLYPEEEPEIVVLPEDQEEMSPEEMLSDNMQAENQCSESQEPEVISEKEIQKILSGMTLNTEHYKQLYQAMALYASELNQYMVTITGVTSNIDWLNDVEESENRTSGVIVANNGRELLILADCASIKDGSELSLTFYNGVRAEAFVKQRDRLTNLAVIYVNIDSLPEETVLKVAPLGSSNTGNMTGQPVVAVGSPIGGANSIGYGIISGVSSQLSVADRSYKLLYTDILGGKSARGVLFNLQGKVIGIITENKADSDIINAYAISDLKKVIEKMSNGNALAYAGIRGIDVTKEANEELNVPYGAYVKEVEMDSPAMLAGIRQGDVIVAMEEKEVDSFEAYTRQLLQMEAGTSVDFKVMRLAQDEYKEMIFSIVLEETQERRGAGALK